eukprot:TRINITY_DN2023_c0_g1_i3.p1 TRINITY_DN2023_c0_g1~~TRINITY_DN2023_c0_g1_i3.p1  ORF type:complete len:254 (-),score=53.13 TRINITY_DN2023_c0_g1_i3:916-1677(-)
MANKTDPSAFTVHGTNPQNLIEKILRSRIYSHRYWKEHCFALTAETLVDKAVDLRAIGGSYGGNQQPTKFICLILKMLQLQPDREIIIEFIKNEDYKYVRALGLFYMRLVGRPQDVYQYLEPYYSDYRKLCYRETQGFSIIHMDEFIEKLLNEDMVCEIVLPRIPKRAILQSQGVLESRKSFLDDDLDSDLEDEESSASEESEDKKKRSREVRDRSKERHRSGLIYLLYHSTTVNHTLIAHSNHSHGIYIAFY